MAAALTLVLLYIGALFEGKSMLQLLKEGRV
jgi:hypothetical protein